VSAPDECWGVIATHPDHPEGFEGAWCGSSCQLTREQAQAHAEWSNKDPRNGGRKFEAKIMPPDVAERHRARWRPVSGAATTYDRLKELYEEATRARWDESAAKARRDFDDGRCFAYGQAMALLRGESVS
jgi:hypothetical protein